MSFKNFEPVATGDGSLTLFSQQYNQCYHSTKDGALVESLHKHVIPSFTLLENKKSLTILDICFGLGYNTLASIYYNDVHDKKPLKIYSPELDEAMLSTLDALEYPKELTPYLHILQTLLKEGSYQDETLSVELYRGDARVYIQSFKNSFDIIYQDAFSPEENPALWTSEYFSDIKKTMKNDAVLTTYSIALKTRIALSNNDFLVYLYKDEKTRSSTLATLEPLTLISELSTVDVEHKKRINPTVKALSDNEL